MIGVLSSEEAAALEAALPVMSAQEKAELYEYLEERERRLALEQAKKTVLGFAHAIYPGFKEGPHHRKLGKIFDAVVRGEKKRVIINIAPRMGKSEFSSYILPAYYLGHFPDRKVIMGTHTASLSEDFGRRIRNLISSEQYTAIFPKTTISEDQKSAGKWSTDAHGQYYAVGVGGALAGRGADLLLIDDPHSEQDIKAGTRTPFDMAWNWFQTGPLQRLMPGGACVVIMTRWSLQDLTARLISHQIKNPDSDKWEVVELPAILHENTDNEKSLWPDQWPLEQLQMKRAGMDPRFWQAQYMQQPTSEVAALIKREQWKVWEGKEPPKCEYIIQSWDTAHETKTSSDYSACIVWGVWFNEEEKDVDGNANIIMLDAIKNRWAFPDLKIRARDYYKEWEPDACLIEKKAAGAPLIQELRSMGIAVSEFSPSRGRVGVSNDKIARLNSIVDMFASGKVWAPDTRWAREVIEEVASFPSGEHDDYVDCTVQALMRLRAGGFIRLPSDEKDEPMYFKSMRNRAYY
jgi:predicted phage terminase large subunit-like protein